MGADSRAVWRWLTEHGPAFPQSRESLPHRVPTAATVTFRRSAGAQDEHRPCVTTRCGLSTLFCCSIGSIDSYRTTPNSGAAGPLPRRDRPRLRRPAES